jgi:photosystem II stability/assembly factor-like uncharacterized protein
MVEVYLAPSRRDSEGTVWHKCLTAMQFVDDRVGWAVGSAQIVRTTNGGRTWNNLFDESMAQLAFAPKKLSAPTRDICWVIDTIGSGKTTCLFTVDAGLTWSPLELGSSEYPRDIFFFNSQRGWLICDNGSSEGGVPVIRSTANGGQTWESQLLNIEGRPEIIRFSDHKYGWLVERILTNFQTESISRLHRTNDGGETWEFVTAFHDRIFDLRIRDHKQIFVCGESGLIASSHNGGVKWHRFSTGIKVAINFITLGGEQTLVAGGDFGFLLLSRDNGYSWRQLRGLNSDANFVGVYLLSESKLIVCSSISISYVDM